MKKDNKMTIQTLNETPAAEAIEQPLVSTQAQPFGRSIKFLLAMVVT